MSQQNKQARATVRTRIPEFKNREEEAKLLDTQHIADYRDGLINVHVRFTKSFSEGITVRWSPEILASLRSQAKKKGIAPATLVRTWIHENFEEKEERLSNQ